MEGLRLEQRHGKARVRVGRVWRDSITGAHHFAEWNVSISLLSDCLPAYTNADNSSIVATDTMKNTVYVKAKECKDQLSVEDFAIVLGKHFTSSYPQDFTEHDFRFTARGEPSAKILVIFSVSRTPNTGETAITDFGSRVWLPANAWCNSLLEFLVLWSL